MSASPIGLKKVLAVFVATLPMMSVQAQLLDPLTQQQFVNELPIPPVKDARGGGYFTLPVKQFSQWLGLRNPSTNNQMQTTVWGYDGKFPGPTILAKSGVKAYFQFPNELKANGNPLPHLLPIDSTAHWADPLNQGSVPGPYTGPVPVITHLHGGHLESQYDGLPDAWYTPDNALTGGKFSPGFYHYENSQRAATIWYHDHALGITRLNVYAGLAGGYVITDSDEERLQKANQVPQGEYDIPLIIQDRMFTETGQLHYPSTPTVGGAPNPSVLPEFFGNFMLVNGMVWPKLEVEPRKYRFRVVNGCDSRFLRLRQQGSLPFQQIGTDGGFMPNWPTLTQLTLGPGERADIVMDFTGKDGQTIELQNIGKTPFPGGILPNPQTDGRVLAFKVVKPLGTVNPPVGNIDRMKLSFKTFRPLTQTGPTRRVLLVDMMDSFNRPMPMLGTTNAGGLLWDAPTTETPQLKQTEVWEIYNTTPHGHPVHLHLVQFQIQNRQSFTADIAPITGALSNIQFTDAPSAPATNEVGWKDTVVAPPGQVTRVIMNFDKVGEFVWHCHILSHEDHEMMRRFVVSP